MKLITAISLLSLLSRSTAEAEGYWVSELKELLFDACIWPFVFLSTNLLTPIITQNRVATFPTCLQLDETCNLDNYSAAYSVSATTEGITAIYTDPFLNAIGFTNIADASNPSPEGFTSLPGKPTTVAVKDDKYAVVAIVTEATGGQISIIDLTSKEIMREIVLDGEPTCKIFHYH